MPNDGYGERFGGVERLLGRSAFDRLRGARVCVIGLGGVGSWTVEALARSGVGGLTLVDLDDVCITNTNRQLHALRETVGQPKAEVLAERVRAINPACAVVPVLAFVTSANVGEILAGQFDVVVDCIDAGRLKAEIVATAHGRGQPVVCVGGAGGRSDPTAVRTGDLGLATGDVLLRRVRRELRSNHGFPRAAGPTARPMGVPAVWSSEPPAYPWADGSCRPEPEPGVPLALDCAVGLGTAAFATGAFGLAAAAEAVRLITSAEEPGDVGRGERREVVDREPA